MQIKYVGLKTDGETAFSEKTKITWMPGDSFTVDAAHAEMMLSHPDVFAIDDKVTAPAGLENVVVPTQTGDFVAPAAIQLPDGSQLIISGMDKEALHKLAKEMDVKIHHSAGAAKVIEALQDAFPVVIDEAPKLPD